MAQLCLQQRMTLVGVYLGGYHQFYYPTFCKVSGTGAQLYATKYVVGEGGKLYDNQDKEQLGQYLNL